MQDMVLLGFLSEGDKTGYEVMRLMEATNPIIFNASPGSIYPAFEKLERDGLVGHEQIIENGRAKKIYSITKEGKKVFRKWMRESPLDPKIRDEGLLKLYFFSRTNKKTRKKALKKYIDDLDTAISKLKDGKKKSMNNTGDAYELDTLDYSIDFYEFNRSWFLNYLDKLEN